MDDPEDPRVGDPRQLLRLRRIEGQVRGLQQMIDDGRPCEETSIQIDAVIAALRRVRADLIRGHVQAKIDTALAAGVSKGERRRAAEDLGVLIGKFLTNPKG